MSIIIPVYNGADTLDRCLSSILRQSFRDYQVIIVDDGSMDESRTVAGRYADRDSRFHLVPIAHRGTGAARNSGLDHARGEYILHMDADDFWIREDLLEQLNRRIESHPTDAFMFRMAKVTEEGHVLARYTKPLFQQADAVLALKDIYQDLVRDGQALASACNKCVRRDLLLEHGIRFREDVLGEDIDWVLQLFSNVQTICLLNLDAYAYTQHRTRSRSTRKDAPNDLVAIVDDWARRIAAGGVSYSEAVAGVLAFEYGICMGNHHLLSRENKKLMHRSSYLLDYGLDRKTVLIRRFCTLFGYHLTCAAVRLYLLLRRIW